MSASSLGASYVPAPDEALPAAGSLSKVISGDEEGVYIPVEEAGVRPNPRMIATTIHLIVMMARVGSRQWRVQELLRVHGWDARTQRYLFSQIQSLQEVCDETQSDVFHNNDGVAAAARVELGRHGGNGAAVGSADDHH